ncbi:MAG: hypothetical protein M1335_02130, partial [Chloroflexi bacterium]|nr:hypothetical protein [Chloroflexota bacterium]
KSPTGRNVASLHLNLTLAIQQGQNRNNVAGGAYSKLANRKNLEVDYRVDTDKNAADSLAPHLQRIKRQIDVVAAGQRPLDALLKGIVGQLKSVENFANEQIETIDNGPRKDADDNCNRAQGSLRGGIRGKLPKLFGSSVSDDDFRSAEESFNAYSDATLDTACLRSTRDEIQKLREWVEDFARNAPLAAKNAANALPELEQEHTRALQLPPVDLLGHGGESEHDEDSLAVIAGDTELNPHKYATCSDPKEFIEEAKRDAASHVTPRVRAIRDIESFQAQKLSYLKPDAKPEDVRREVINHLKETVLIPARADTANLTFGPDSRRFQYVLANHTPPRLEGNVESVVVTPEDMGGEVLFIAYFNIYYGAPVSNLPYFEQAKREVFDDWRTGNNPFAVVINQGYLTHLAGATTSPKPGAREAGEQSGSNDHKAEFQTAGLSG